MWMPFLPFSEDWLIQWKSCKILRNCTKYWKSLPGQTHQKSTYFQHFTSEFRGFLADTNYINKRKNILAGIAEPIYSTK